MKKINFFLLTILLLHGLLLIILNFNSLNFLKNKQSELNGFGKWYANNNLVIKIPEILTVYLNYIGSDRGYAYYSPNISHEKIAYTIFDQDKNKINPVSNAPSSKFRFDIIMVNSTKIIENQKIQNKIIKSLSEYIFIKEPNAEKLTLQINRKRLKTIQEFQKEKKLYDVYNLDAYIIERK